MAFLETLWEKHHGNDGGFARHYLTLYALTLGIEAKKVFEFGCGFSTHTILAALEKTNGTLVTNDMRTKEAIGHGVETLTQNPKWIFKQGMSHDVLPRMEETGFDLVLHDGSHDFLPVFKDIRAIFRKMKKDGLIVMHDTVSFPKLEWSARLALLFTPHQIVTLPYGFGLTIIRIKKDFGHGKVSLTWDKDRNKK